MPESAVSDAIDVVLHAVADHAREEDVFESVNVHHGVVVATGRDTPAPVYYRLEVGDNGVHVSWNTPDRYLSQSIEADLMWTGDDLDDLIDEELVDLGWNRGKLGPLSHYRNDELLFTFRSPVPVKVGQLSTADSEDLARCLLAYEIAFRELGDMQGDDGEDGERPG